MVKPGDIVAKDQPILELETDKATIEVPSSVAGQVKEIKVKAGDKVKVGQAILSVDENGAATSLPAPQRDEQQRDAPKQQAQEPSKQAVGANPDAEGQENAA